MVSVVKKSLFTTFSLILLLSVASCVNDLDSVKDLNKPEIIGGIDAYPKNCDVYYKGDSIPVTYTMKDDIELGEFNIEIHNNFDHHTHPTEMGSCELDPIKAPVNPWVFNQYYSIPAHDTLYTANIKIPIPEYTKDGRPIDEGDYHFMIRLTDASGWQQLKALSIKIRSRK